MPIKRHTTGILGLSLIDTWDVGSLTAIDPGAILLLDILNQWASALDAAVSSAGPLISLGVIATTGDVDGSNAVFTLATKPSSGLLLFKNGIFQHRGSTEDFMYDANVTITFDAGNIPQIGDALVVIGY